MNILEAISYSLRLFQVTSLAQYKLESKVLKTKRSIFLEIYAWLVILLSTTITFLGVFFVSIDKNDSKDVGDTVDLIQLFGIRICHIASVVESILTRHEQQNLIKNVAEIDRIFEMSLNVDVDNTMFRSTSIKHGLFMTVLYLSSEICTYITSEYLFGLLFWIMYLLPLLVCGIRYYQYLLSVLIIKKRFEKLIDALKNISLLKRNKIINVKAVESFQATLNIMKNEQYEKPFYLEGLDIKNVLVIQDLYNRLWEVTISVNRCFGFSILMNIGNDFLSITSNCYWLFLNFNGNLTPHTDYVHIFGSAVWTMPHFYNIISLAMTCHKTVEKTHQIALGLHNIQIDLFNENHNSLIEQFSLQLLHQKVNFTAFGFFTIDCSLLYTIVGATTTYLIILIQFHMSEQKGATARNSSTIFNVTQ